MDITAKQALTALQEKSDKKIAEHSARFFKTAEGEYGEDDIFLGIRVPVIRSFVKRWLTMPLLQNEKLLHSPYHEARLAAVILLSEKFKRADSKTQKAIYQLYLNNTAYINNWDIVDSSSHKIIGPYLFEKSHQPLFKLVKSDQLWERRIAIITTYYFIKRQKFETALELISQTLTDKEDLIHKASGWMLREIGNKDRSTEESFLNEHYQVMPRTMLRYAIEKFPLSRRKYYLKK
ncbi:DNA alkylation repair protein [Haliea sp. AH-315-K21]|uniref:DNA alkylation repair protein n=1 Tax=SAR86 cluster bacterium TaxID=2030880 RepID=A0A2A5CJ84_9GAMM|nr:DNA alkylation repair protein [Haliea sp. AH-315-K21]MBN4075056.1 DNA alkylation repair protein [Gammaproteobacteria bacterium AH-315-E17]PCJ41800.1 MAG: DNA alkylation repair protein [SAR86 cluster bacterium]PCJ43823.1 MAG: DNA alkylation repair protein [SAR86 cluster bacterium]